MKDELAASSTSCSRLLRGYGLDDFYLELSTKDPEKYVGSDESLGGGDRDPATRSPSSPGLELVRRPGRGRVLRPEDLGAGA